MIAEPITRNNSVTFTGFLHRLDQCIDQRLNIHVVIPRDWEGGGED